MDDRMHLTPRLRIIMDTVPEGARLADIGTDHALIPTALLKRNKISFAIASDIRQGPLKNAEKTAKQFGQYDKMSLRLSAGLDKIKPDEIDTIVIAGMGGETICEILANAPWAMNGEYLLILQAMTGSMELRQFLSENGIAIEQERICREGKRFYTVITASGGAKKEHKSKNLCCISESMLKDPLAKQYLTQRLEHERKIISALSKAKNKNTDELELRKSFEKTYINALESISGAEK